MKLSDVMSRERIVNGVKSVGKLRVKLTHGSILTFSVLLLMLLVAFTIRVFPLRWEIQTGSLHLSEFDPYYQFSLTRYMVNHGIFSPYWPTQWVDHQRWYPDGINMGSSLSSLPMTAAISYEIINALGVNIDLMSFCSLFPAIAGTLGVLFIYFLGKDIAGKEAGMLSALFLALSPAVIQRNSLGFFDTEVVGIISLILCSLMFLRAIEEERSIGSSVKYSIGAAAFLAYFIMGWGAAYYMVGLVTLFVFVLLLLRRYTRRLFLTYSVTFGLSLLVAINNPDIAPHYLTSTAVLPVAGVFILLCLTEILHNLTSAREKVLFFALFLALIVGGFAVLAARGYVQNIGGKFYDVIDPFLRQNSPVVESVAEHRISSWGSIYYDLGIGILFFALGLFFVLRNLNNKNLFLLLFGLTSLYFAVSMVRLLFVLAPAFSILASMGIVGLLKPFVTLLKEPPKINIKKRIGLEHVGKEFSGIAIFLIFLILMTNFAFSPQSGGMPKVLKEAYAPVTITAASLPIAPSQPVREWLDQLTYLNNLGDSSIVVCSWWDYGYWLSILGNVTSLADNATINGTQIENVGFTFMANETQSLKMLKLYNAKYILVFTTLRADTGAWLGYGDEGKWTWMARISGGAQQRFLDEGFTDEQSSWNNETKFGSYNSTTNQWIWNDAGKNSTIYKLMSYGKHEWISKQLGSSTANQDTDYVGAPTYFEEANFAGVNLSSQEAGSNYGGIVPLVLLYQINWQKYYSDFPAG
jgi:dolichyl-diphosphooligosaccharide--protein glycosyltransferase